MVGIKHTLAMPFHPQTNGKLERYHQILKRDVNEALYGLPVDLEAAIAAFGGSLSSDGSCSSGVTQPRVRFKLPVKGPERVSLLVECFIRVPRLKGVLNVS